MNTNLFDFIKSAANYSQETNDIVTLAYGIVNDMQVSQQKCAEMVPGIVTKLASTQRVNNQPFVPDGFEKRANELLSDHASTVKLLSAVLDEYNRLKAAHEKLTPTIGTIGKTASERSSMARDGHESKAMQMWTDRLVNI